MEKHFISNKIFETIKNIFIERNIESETLNNFDSDMSEYLDTDLSVSGLDSIMFISIVVALEEAFEIEVPDEKLLITEMNTINKMLDVVSAAIESKNG